MQLRKRSTAFALMMLAFNCFGCSGEQEPTLPVPSNEVTQRHFNDNPYMPKEAREAASNAVPKRTR